MPHSTEEAENIPSPLIGIGYRLQIDQWIKANLDKFDVLEITVDHYIQGGTRGRNAIKELVGNIPLVAHGVGLSIGTDLPVDQTYMDQVARTIEDLEAPSYSEHLAWTKTDKIDFANLLPLPKTVQVAEIVIEKAIQIREFLGIPFELENISYVFDFPDSYLSDAEFLTMVCSEAGAGILLDVENLYVNCQNHLLDPEEFFRSLPKELVRGMHMAGGPIVQREYLDSNILVDNHSHPVPEGALKLLKSSLMQYSPYSIILERDDMVHQVSQLRGDVGLIRECVSEVRESLHVE